MSQLKPLMENNFLEYASYVIIDRAIPDQRDGCKPVQRRILHTLFDINDGKFHKVANVIGETMKLHPHGDASIRDALVVLANKEYFIEKQGNFGNILTGHEAAAPRYIECRLTQLALDTLFNRALTEFTASYDGRKNEPVFLPAKIPVLLMLGTEGIAVGMSTRILPHNFIELLQACIDVLNEKAINLYPDFPTGGRMDVAEYSDGVGRVRLRAKIDKVNEKKLVVREIPYSATTTSLIASIESAVIKGKVSVSAINDFTTEKIEIELITSRGVTSAEVIPQLFAHTECEMTINSNMVVIDNNRPAEISVSEYIHSFTKQLKNLIKAELEYELEKLTDKQHWLTLEQIFIENKIYSRLEKAKSEKDLKAEVYIGMTPFKARFVREMTDDDVKKLLELQIRRISVYDISRNQGEIDIILEAIKGVKARLKNITRTSISYLKDLCDKYTSSYPRLTVIESFDTVDKRAVAKANIRLTYDKDSSYFGAVVRGKDFVMTVSEYERILTIAEDGTYRIIAPPDKLFFPSRLIYCAPFDQQEGIEASYVYLDSQKNAWAKRVRIEKFITDKVYTLFTDPASAADDGSLCSLLYFSIKKNLDKIRLYLKPAKRQKIKEVGYDLNTVKTCGLGARGTRLYNKPVAKLTIVGRNTVVPPNTGKVEKSRQEDTAAPKSAASRKKSAPAKSPRKKTAVPKARASKKSKKQ